MEKDTGSKIDAPSFGGMLHIGVGLFGIVWQIGVPPYKALLEDVEEYHYWGVRLFSGGSRMVSRIELIRMISDAKSAATGPKEKAVYMNAAKKAA